MSFKKHKKLLEEQITHSQEKRGPYLEVSASQASPLTLPISGDKSQRKAFLFLFDKSVDSMTDSIKKDSNDYKAMGWNKSVNQSKCLISQNIKGDCTILQQACNHRKQLL